jgi:hypothetical protein
VKNDDIGWIYFTMITHQQLDEIVSWDGLKQFGNFVLSHCQDGNLPDYKKMNLMLIPRLVPYIWVTDLRNYEIDGKRIVNFAGEKINREFGKNVVGEIPIDVFRDNPFFESMSEFYKNAIDAKMVAYSRRYGEHDFGRQGGSKYRYAESLYFPCSSDGEHVNWAIGCVCFNVNPFTGESVFLRF